MGPAVLALPYAWRFCQCIRVFLDTGARPQLFNAAKYSTAFPVIALWAMRSSATDDNWCAAAPLFCTRISKGTRTRCTCELSPLDFA